jgi:SAM-dependent methyltransferase
VQWFDGTAEELPIPSDSVEAVICILAAHHFKSLWAAVAEMSRVCATGPIIWLTFDPREANGPWFADHSPTLWEGTASLFPAIGEVCRTVAEFTGRGVGATPFLIPADLEDWFMGAGWRRPEMYLDPHVRAGMSAFSLADAETVDEGLRRLASDLESGEWRAAYGDILERDWVDWGYRLLVAK